MNHRTIAILRGHEPQEAADLAARCWDIGMDLVEVPVQGDRGWAALKSVAARAEGRAFGAGTVLSVPDARRALGEGATVIISPGIDAEVVEATQAAGATSLPGVMTPTEVGLADRLGVSTCKFFPAGVLGAGWLGAIRGPFPSMRFIAVGGVDAGNAKDLVAQGAAGVAFGSSLDALLTSDRAATLIQELHSLLSP